jgi:hypothetical protein
VGITDTPPWELERVYPGNYRNSTQKISKALDTAEGIRHKRITEYKRRSKMYLKIRNATPDQWATVADMARANVGLIEGKGVGKGVGLVRWGVSVYLYLTVGNTLVAYVNTLDKEK